MVLIMPSWLHAWPALLVCRLRGTYNQSHRMECTHFPLSLTNPYFSPEDIFIYLNMCNQGQGEHDEC